MFSIFFRADLGSLFVHGAPELVFCPQRTGTKVVTAADQKEMAHWSGTAGGVNQRVPSIVPKVGAGLGRDLRRDLTRKGF